MILKHFFLIDFTIEQHLAIQSTLLLWLFVLFASEKLGLNDLLNCLYYWVRYKITGKVPEEYICDDCRAEMEKLKKEFESKEKSENDV